MEASMEGNCFLILDGLQYWFYENSFQNIVKGLDIDSNRVKKNSNKHYKKKSVVHNLFL